LDYLGNYRKVYGYDNAMSSKKIANSDNSVGWSGALQAAELEIRKAKSRLAALTKSIRICKEKLNSGEPWPGDKATQPPSQ
jgi:hypothetical protein